MKVIAEFGGWSFNTGLYTLLKIITEALGTLMEALALTTVMMILLDTHTDSLCCRWDGWVPQDRLRKWNEENHELAKTLKKEMDSINQQRSKTTVSSKKRGDVSARDSEERNIAGRKRGRDYDTEKVRFAIS